MTPRHTQVTVASRAEAATGRRSEGPEQHADASACKHVNALLARVGDKWSMLVVRLLGNGPRRFNEIKRLTGTGGISQRMLTLTLRGLERDGMVTRTAFPTIPPRVDYELTALGHSLSEPIEALGRWAIANISIIDAARLAFDRRNPRPMSLSTEDLDEPAVAE